MKLERLDHYGLEVRDLRHAEHFYTTVLGFTVVARFGDQVLMECGGQNLALFGVRRPPLTDEQRARVDWPSAGQGPPCLQGRPRRLCPGQGDADRGRCRERPDHRLGRS